MVVVVVALFGAACGGDGSGDGADAAGGSDDGGTPTTEASEDDGGTTQITVLYAKNTKFDPTEITVDAGEPFQFNNSDQTKHNFTASDAGIDHDVPPTASTSVDVSDVEPGTYDFVCKYHPTMTGTMEIIE